MANHRIKAGTSRAAAAQRRALFVEAFVANGGNATQAAIEAGFSAKSARRRGTELATDRHISAEIEKRRSEALAKAQSNTDLTVAGVLRELHGIVHSDVRGAFDDNGALLPPKRWPDHVAKAIASVKVVEMAGGAKIGGPEALAHIPMYTKEVKLWDKNSGIEKAMKHLGLYEADNKQVAEALKKVSDAELATELERYTALARNAHAGAGAGESATPRASAKKPR